MDSDSALPEGFAAAFATGLMQHLGHDTYGDNVWAKFEPEPDERAEAHGSLTADLLFEDDDESAWSTYDAEGLRRLSAQLAEIAGILEAERPLQVGDEARSTATGDLYEILAVHDNHLWAKCRETGALMTSSRARLERAS